MFELSPHGTDVYVGAGPQYPWGGLYGGQIVAQALRAATLSVDDGLEPHSIRAYFIRRGDHHEPVRYEVDRIRNGRSFATRRVVARQAIGAILNAESSFQRPESAARVQSVEMPVVPAPDDLLEDSWSNTFGRAFVPVDRVTGAVGTEPAGSSPGCGSTPRSVIRPIAVAAVAPVLAGLSVRRPPDRHGDPGASVRDETNRCATRCSAPASTTRSGSTGD